MVKKLAVLVIGGILMVGCDADAAQKKAFSAEREAIALIAKHEGFRSEPYKCPGGQWTIGYGFTDASLVKKGKLTRAEADRHLGILVRKELKWARETFPKLSERQLVAIVSLAYNIGHDRVLYKTVGGKRVHTNAYLNLIGGNYEAAAKEIAEFRCANGKVLNGLVKRRTAEIKYLLS